MFIPLVIFFVSAVSIASAQDSKPQLYVLENGVLTPISKVEAIIHLAKNQGGQVLKCSEQVLSDKATIVSKK